MKLPNILMQRPTLEERQQGELPIVKLCDFGISQVIKPQEYKGQNKALMKDRSGTAGYIAPEIKTNNTLIGPEIDMWAFGVMLYEMCTAYKPTQLQNYRYGGGPIPFRARDWKKLDGAGSIV